MSGQGVLVGRGGGVWVVLALLYSLCDRLLWLRHYCSIGSRDENEKYSILRSNPKTIGDRYGISFGNPFYLCVGVPVWGDAIYTSTATRYADTLNACSRSSSVG